VKTGEIAAMDRDAETITLKDKSGKSTDYSFLTDKIKCLKAKRAAKLSDFKPGDTVVIHVRKSRKDNSYSITEIADPASWDWLTEMRRKLTTATITELDEESLAVTVGPDNLPLSYVVSEKTRWMRNGKEATAADFKAGEKVSIVPRALPSGNIMASVVSDTQEGAAQGKERKALSVHGVIKSLDPTAKKITLLTVAKDERTLRMADELEVHSGSKTLPLTALKTGQHINARVRHADMEEDTVYRITLETGSRTTAPKKPAGGTAGKKPGTIP
jgi:Cu/Ag efflux protein CusF